MIMDLHDEKVKKPGKNRNFRSSFGFAICGLLTALKEERNMRIHFVVGGAVCIVGIFLQLAAWEWLWLLFAIFSVWVMEILNTVFENLVDLVTEGYFHPIAKKVKDMAAAGVLMTAAFAVIVGVFLFIPKLFLIFQKIFGN